MKGQFEVQISKSAAKELKSLPAKEVPRILDEIRKLQTDACPAGSKKLVGSANCYRLRQGDYRILYMVEGSVIKVTNIVHRREAYR